MRVLQCVCCNACAAMRWQLRSMPLRALPTPPWRPPFSIPDDLRSPSVAPSLRAELRAEIGRALRGDACGPELQPEFEPVVKPKGSGCRRPVISEASHRHLRED